MENERKDPLFLIFLFLFISPCLCWDTGEGASWNALYGSQGVTYTTEDDAILYLSDVTDSPYTCDGCFCNETDMTISNCVGPDVTLIGFAFTSIRDETFSSSVTSITIRSVPTFTTIEDDAFMPLTELLTLTVEGTSLDSVPYLTHTKVTVINMQNNAIRMTSLNRANGWYFPDTLTHLVLSGNQMHWIPTEWIGGPNLRIASFANNQISQLSRDAFREPLTSLFLLNMEANNLKSISGTALAAVADSLIHLRLQNNELTTIGSTTFRQMTELRILEMKANNLSAVSYETFYNIGNLLHLDLNENQFSVLTKDFLKDLPNLRRLYLQRQSPPLTNIAYDAWSGIGSNLQYLYINENALTAFPHPVMSRDSYPSLVEIYASYNSISNSTAFESQAYPSSSQWMYKADLLTFQPYNFPNLESLYLDNNQIVYMNNTDFCNSPRLYNLYLGNNLISETTIEESALACMTNLSNLDIPANVFQYVPDAFKQNEDLPAIQTLTLTSNMITFISGGSFTNLSTLVTLNLQYNLILTVDDNSFPEQIQSIHLNGNAFRFQHTNPFSYLSNLIVLDLSSNSIKSLPDDAFLNCTSLETLYLNSNQIPQIRRATFENCPLSDQLHLENNEIGLIEDGTFSHMTSTGIMSFANNKLSILPENGSFTNLTVRSTFDFSSNRIVALPPYGFTDSYLGYFKLQNNLITTITRGTFSVMSADHIDLRGNLLHTIEDEAFLNASVSNIDLSNSYITTIQGNTFYAVNAGNVYLNGNPITDIAPYAFRSSTFRNLYMMNSSLTDLSSYTFYDVTVTESLDISYGQLQSLQTDAFYNVQVGNTLDLSNNSLTEFTETSFGVQSSFAGLNLAHNQIIRFPTIPSMPALSTINLRSNNIETVSSSVLSGLTGLSTLKLKGNPLACECETFYALYDIASAIEDGECIDPASSIGVDFSSSKNTDPDYFMNTNPRRIPCSGTNVAVSSTETTLTFDWNRPASFFQSLQNINQISVTWSSWQDAVDNSQQGGSTLCTNTGATNPTDGSPCVCDDSEVTMLNSDKSLTYNIHCESGTGSTLQTSVVDPCGSLANLQYVFTDADGMESGVVYDCSVTLTAEGQTSAKSETIQIVSALPETDSLTSSTDLTFVIKYYDFTFLHPDFEDSADIDVSTPTYVSSPYGAWLSVSNNPTSDTFSDWFRSVPGINYEYSSTIKLPASTGTVKRFYSDSFFPMDGFGYDEKRADCSGNLHNFGFTSAIRSALSFSGTEKITVGGGEGLWLYINKVLVVESVVDSTTSTMACYKVDLSLATTAGGGSISLERGDVNGGTCTNLASVSNSVHLELEVGEVYHFDLFHAETRTCSSWFLLEVEDSSFISSSLLGLSSDVSSDGSASVHPVDYSVAVDEDYHIDGILQTFDLTDVFSVGPYTITLFKGNEARHFSIKEDTTTNRNADVAPTVTYTYSTVNTSNGDSLSYVECATAPSVVAESSDLTPETFSVSSTTVLLTMLTELDYEVKTVYKLAMEVVDEGTQLTGTIAITVKINDINDNCPIIASPDMSLMPEPILQSDHIAQLESSDGDTGTNAEIEYIFSLPTKDPNISYNSSYDLHNDVYRDFTVLTFQVIAMDMGSPRRGASITVSVNVSNTCVIDGTYDAIEYEFIVNSTGHLFLRIPGYFVYEYLCLDALGLESGVVVDALMTSSSASFPEASAWRGRLNTEQKFLYTYWSGGWVAGVADTDQYIQVDMNSTHKFRQIQIQGRDGVDEWVETFKIQYADSETDGFTEYTDITGTNIFTGNTDSSTVITVDLDPFILAQYIRINPQQWHGDNIALRLELIGCSQAKQQSYDVTCRGCEATWYCTGDGVQRPCGRCDPPVEGSTCGRNATEHSFGKQSECSECPAGWKCKDGYATVCERFHYVECDGTSCPSMCSPCGEGYACFDGRRTKCGVGKYSNGSTEFCQSCPAGYYQDEEGQGSCKVCPAGYYTSRSKSQCERCSINSYSTGSTGECIDCTSDAECPCRTGAVCFNGSDCSNTGSGGYECGDCPLGFEADGSTCVDIDECTVYQPCADVSNCLNTEPGYQCLECPDGYTGTYEDALAWNNTRRVFLSMNTEYAALQVQTCEDVDECATDNGGCDADVECINTVGSFSCGLCPVGYMGNTLTGCVLSDFCVSGSHDCGDSATCIYTGPGEYRCECNDGSAGSGNICDDDSDSDGFPDSSVPCIDWGCLSDNCPGVPNSVQEDNDSDNIGDSCDDDDDNDVTDDIDDNCPFVKNYYQEDTDRDGIGDACDNCPASANTDQADNDHDGMGDICDDDDDDDGHDDTSDNCPMVSNSDQSDGDSDGVGDACDNCITLATADQTDTDNNGVGDACDDYSSTFKDSDGDSVLNSLDNCPELANGDQSDIDEDGIGDLCDTDIDEDGVLNSADNCPYFSNALQEDTDGDRLGDQCEGDSDQDGVEDKNDTCPYNPTISSTSFLSYFTVDLDPTLNTTLPNWQVHGNGAEVTQLESSSEMPTILIGNQVYGEMKYSGTWYVGDTTEDEYIGCVFGYVSNRKFYLVTWKRSHYNYQESTYKGGLSGIQLKVVHSSTGPSEELAHALWHSDDTADQLTLLWHQAEMLAWEPGLAYRWHIIHRPSTGYIKITVYQGSSLLLDSGALYDSTITGGRVGVFQFGSLSAIWSNLKVECLTRLNKALYLEGTESYVQLSNLAELSRLSTTSDLTNDKSFTFEVWIYPESGATSYPIFCTLTGNVCLQVIDTSVDLGFQVLNFITIMGQYGTTVISSLNTISLDEWNNIVFRYSQEEQILALFVNGVEVTGSPQTDVSSINWNSVTSDNEAIMYLGRNEGNYFKGAMDEVRLYGIAVPDNEIMNHVTEQSLSKEYLQGYVNVHFTMQDSSTGDGTVTNTGLASTAVTTFGTITYIDGVNDFKQFQLQHPTN